MDMQADRPLGSASGESTPSSPAPSRRSFLAAAGAGAVGLASGSSAGAQRRASGDIDVIVIGGGFAGVTAARDLQKSGLRTLVLEARDRLGGRTWSTEMEGWKVELGGTWIHWAQPFVWSEVSNYGLEIEETPGAAPDRMILLVDGNRRELTEAEVAEAFAGFDRFFREARQAWERPYDMHFRWQELVDRDPISVAQHVASLELTPLQQTIVIGFLEVLAHAPAEQASYVEMLRCWALAGMTYPLFADSLSRYKLTHGTGSLVEAMVADGGFEVRLEAEVQRVRQEGAGVMVELAGGETVAARAVVVAIPLNTLVEVDFSPPLAAAKIAASKERHAGAGFKVFLEVEGDPGKLMTLATSKSHPLGACFTYHQGEPHSLLAGFGVDPSNLEKNTAAWQESLRELLPDIRVTRAFGHGWTLDPYARGTWCNFKPGQLSRYADELGRAEGRLVFASADSTEGWRGFIDGAIASGGRAARAVVAMLS